MKPNTLYYGDCLEVMSAWPDACVDLIYLDPPFNSKVNYNVLFGPSKHGVDKNDLAQLTAFTDTWEWDREAAKRVRAITKAVDHPAHRAIAALKMLYPDGSGMLSYLSYMAERVAEMSRLLKDNGSVYLHCDPTASHYLKIIMDEVFGRKNFRNEIIWGYKGMGNRQSAKFQSRHDVLLFYAGGIPVFNFQFGEPTPESMKTYKSAARVGYLAKHSRMLVTVFDWGKYKEAVKNGKLPKGMKEKEFDGGKPLISDWWPDIKILGGPHNKERLGYPTQKPLALLNRIIATSSNEGDVVLDPFCGCGTTIEAAHNLKRNWLGIDISTYALEVIRQERMKDIIKIDLEGVPKDINAAAYLAKNKPFDFEKWAVTRIPGFAPNTVQVGDGGIDGRAKIFNAPKGEDLCIVQVKGGTPSIDSLRAFSHVISGKAAIGVFITLKKWNTPAVKKCVVEAGAIQVGTNQFPRLVMYSIAEYFAGAKPNLPPLAHPRTGHPLQEDLLTSHLNPRPSPSSAAST